ncbi:MAG: hypothetical protein ABI794_05030 [Betaproteobacteria bacterium]
MNARKSLILTAALTLMTAASAFAYDAPVLQDNRGGHDRPALGAVQYATVAAIGTRDRSGNAPLATGSTRTVQQVAVNVTVPRDGSGT